MAADTNILKRPIITEKMTSLGDRMQRYAFVVETSANKLQIKEAVEGFYEGVTVVAVNTMKMPAKTTQRYSGGRFVKGRKKGYKKAVITLQEGDSIDFYSNI